MAASTYTLTLLSFPAPSHNHDYMIMEGQPTHELFIPILLPEQIAMPALRPLHHGREVP